MSLHLIGLLWIGDLFSSARSSGSSSVCACVCACVTFMNSSLYLHSILMQSLSYLSAIFQVYFSCLSAVFKLSFSCLPAVFQLSSSCLSAVSQHFLSSRLLSTSSLSLILREYLIKPAEHKILRLVKNHLGKIVDPSFTFIVIFLSLNETQFS